MRQQRHNNNVLNLVIFADTEVGQIHLNIVAVLISPTNMTAIIDVSGNN